MSDTFVFEGFKPSTTTPVPDALFDELLTKLSGSELKVMLYIIRRTLGFKKTTDAISLTQFEKGITTKQGNILDKGCGLNRDTICKALHSLERKGCITSQKRLTDKRDNDITLYSVRFDTEPMTLVGKTDHPLVGKLDYGSPKKQTRVVRKSDPQETVLQETVLQENTFVQNDKTGNVSFVTLARDGGGIVNLTEDEAHQSTEEEEVSHSQWLSESVQEAEEAPAPGGQAPTGSTVPAPAAALKGIQPSHDTPNNATGQARTEHATKQPTRIIPPVITLPSKDKTDENGKCKKDEKPLLTKTADVRALINAFRGFALEARGPIINENTIIRELCELHTLDHFTATMGHLRTCQCKKHKWWREGNQGGFKAENLRDLLPDILSELGMIPKPEEPPFVPAVPRAIKSSYTPWAPHEEIIPRAAVAH